MAYQVVPLERLVEQFERLPGIGRKTAGRLAYHLLSRSDAEAKAFADAILEAKEKIHRRRTGSVGRLRGGGSAGCDGL